MGEATNMFPNSNDEQQFRLNRINEIKYYFMQRFMKRINVY